MDKTLIIECTPPVAGCLVPESAYDGYRAVVTFVETLADFGCNRPNSEIPISGFFQK
jgi:hypothetical protein